MCLCVPHLASKLNILIISTILPFDKCTLLETLMEVDVNISIPIPLDSFQMNKFHPCVGPCIHSLNPNG
jgi:hypothetical protein